MNKNALDVMFSAKREDWTTPKDLFKQLDERFHFTLDAASSDENALCDKHYTISNSGLEHSWQGENVFLNPPYCRKIGDWVRKAHDEWFDGDCTIVMLLPARTDTAWFQDFIYNQAEVTFIRGRLKFGDGKNSAPFPSMIVVFERGKAKDVWEKVI